MSSPETRSITSTKLERIAWLSGRDGAKRFDHVMHLFTEEALAECFRSLDGSKAVGTDGVTKARYGEDLEGNLKDLHRRLRTMAYRPGPVREARIPKPGSAGKTRSLGISNLEDKIVQGMIHRVLAAIYEPLFLDCSYGFRPGRGAHDAVRDLHHYLYRHRVSTVIDVDLSRYFDSIDQQRLLGMIGKKLGDRRFLRYLSRQFKAGVLREGELSIQEDGVVQGSLCSPILANIFAHTVIDEWFEETVKRHCRGAVALFRYADDVVICCESEHDSIRVLKALRHRLERFGLRLNEEKTRVVRFARPTGKAHPRAAFDFLGFTFYWGRSRNGHPIPKVKTSGARLRASLRRVREWASTVRNRRGLLDIWRTFCAKVRGHLRYYGVSFNYRALQRFIRRATYILYKWLNRRSQRRSFTWKTFLRFMDQHPLPRPVIHVSLFAR
jgi:RNA-directed DNA polymerase